MNTNIKFLISLISTVFLMNHAQAEPHDFSDESDNVILSQVEDEDQNVMDELNPFDPEIEEKLNDLDNQYYLNTGKFPYLSGGLFSLFETSAADLSLSKCRRESCAVWVRVDRSEQQAYVYVKGELVHTWLVSTGVAGFATPNFDTHPNGRIYDAYSSKKFPGGDYKGLGNMPYAIFISGGFAIHGTTVSNFPKLGKPASHGCIRLHSENALILNRLVRQYGIPNTWFTVEE